MKILFVLPGWPKGRLWGELGFKFPSLSLAVLAAATPPDWETALCDENIETVNFAADADLVAITAMTPQAPRAYEIAAQFRARGNEVPRHLEIEHPRVAGRGEGRPDDRPAEVELDAPEKDEDDVHEREHAVVESRGEDDDRDERDVDERLDEGEREVELPRPLEGVPDEKPAVGQHDGRVQVLEAFREQELLHGAVVSLRDVLGCDRSPAGGKEVQHVEDE